MGGFASRRQSAQVKVALGRERIFVMPARPGINFGDEIVTFVPVTEVVSLVVRSAR